MVALNYGQQGVRILRQVGAWRKDDDGSCIFDADKDLEEWHTQPCFTQKGFNSGFVLGGRCEVPLLERARLDLRYVAS